MFGRRKNKDNGEAIAEFWRWWADARHETAARISDGSVATMAQEFSTRVAAIDSDLQWELSKGSQSQHALVVTPAGDPALRSTAARWLAAAPAADAVFEYVSSRQPDDGVLESRIQIDGHELALEDLRFAFTVTEQAHDLDVAVFHPSFPVLSEETRLQVTFLSLDWALGEEQVELWVGEVNSLTTSQDNLRTVAELRAAVADLVAKHIEPVYTLLSAENGGQPMLAMVQVPLRSARWPRFDTHLAIRAGYPADSRGLPTDESLARLRDLEDQVATAVASDGGVIAHETSAGVRTIHVYVDGSTSARDGVKAVVAAFRALKAKVSVTADPGLDRVGHLRP